MGPSQDSGVYFHTLRKLVKLNINGASIKVADVGTGTGIMTKDLIASIATYHRLSLSHRPQSENHRTWRMDSEIFLAAPSTFLDKALELEDEVDLLIFAAGGISHLTRDARGIEISATDQVHSKEEVEIKDHCLGISFIDTSP
jgi:hypothetical protein